MTEPSSPKPILGFTDSETVMLDFDDTPFQTVKYWASRTANWFTLDGFLILKSSEQCYHVVFNRQVSWTENMHIVAWVCLESHHEKLKQWFLMQCIKESSTLRISPKGKKPSPRIVYRCGAQYGQVQGFLTFRQLIKHIIRKTANM